MGHRLRELFPRQARSQSVRLVRRAPPHCQREHPRRWSGWAQLDRLSRTPLMQHPLMQQTRHTRLWNWVQHALLLQRPRTVPVLEQIRHQHQSQSPMRVQSQEVLLAVSPSLHYCSSRSCYSTDGVKSAAARPPGVLAVKRLSIKDRTGMKKMPQAEPHSMSTTATPTPGPVCQQLTEYPSHFWARLSSRQHRPPTHHGRPSPSPSHLNRPCQARRWL